MSDDQKKPEREFFDEKTGILHGSACPKTKKEFGDKESDGSCALEDSLKKIQEHVRKAIPYQPDTAPTTGGPAQVASKDYREGWDRIFGTRPTVGKA